MQPKTTQSTYFDEFMQVLISLIFFKPWFAYKLDGPDGPLCDAKAVLYMPLHAIDTLQRCCARFCCFCCNLFCCCCCARSSRVFCGLRVRFAVFTDLLCKHFSLFKPKLQCIICIMMYLYQISHLEVIKRKTELN